jgi:hypothetical protein
MNFLLCYAFNCTFGILVIQLTIHRLLYHSIDHAINNHSTIQPYLNHSIGLCTMPVTTRSQTKLLGISTEFSENKSVSPVRLVGNHPSHPSSTVEHLDSSLTLPSSDFVDLVMPHCDSNLPSNGNLFKISKFEIFDATSGSFIAS